MTFKLPTLPTGFGLYRLIAEVILVGLIVLLFTLNMRTNAKLGEVRIERKNCIANYDALAKQVKADATKGGKTYEKSEADWRAQCSAAYDAGAKRLRDDQAIAAGRYMPGGSPSRSGR